MLHAEVVSPCFPRVLDFWNWEIGFERLRCSSTVLLDLRLVFRWWYPSPVLIREGVVSAGCPWSQKEKDTR